MAEVHINADKPLDAECMKVIASVAAQVHKRFKERKMITTAVIQIGNSDDKLTQREFSEYWGEMVTDIDDLAEETHFSGGSSANNPWQNYCWVVAIKESNAIILMNRLRAIREKYRQDSVAVLVGQTEFV